MKKYLIRFAMLAMLFASCSQNGVLDSDIVPKDDVVGFSTYANKTRGVPMDNNIQFSVSGSSFGVTAFIELGYDNPYMGTLSLGAPIDYGGSVWNYRNISDSRFWPKNGETLSFYAYSPFLDVNRVAPLFSKTTGMTFLNYEITTDPIHQKDFMFATAIGQSKPASGNNVNLQFKHALTQIHFTARTQSDNLYVDIAANGISLNKINARGTFSVNTTAKWEVSNKSTLTTYSAPSNELKDDNAIKYNAGLIYQNITLNYNSLMLMPQEFKAWNPDDGPATSTLQEGAYLTILCKIYTKDSTGNKIYIHGNQNAYSTVYVPISSRQFDGSEIWTMGNKVTYNLIFGGGFDENGNSILSPITFTTDVDAWNVNEGMTINF